MKRTFERYYVEAVEAPSKFLVRRYNRDVILNGARNKGGLAI
ncbi:MAG: hypothetical protein ACE5OW_05345 [Candidatus Bathyarchaeia archaeon]